MQMFLEGAKLRKRLVTVGIGKRLISCISPLLFLQVARVGEIIVTPSAAKKPSMGFMVCLKATIVRQDFSHSEQINALAAASVCWWQFLLGQ